MLNSANIVLTSVGVQHVLTPHLAQLAGAGLVLEQHYSQQVCSPTRGALLTGRWETRVDTCRCKRVIIRYPLHNGLQNGLIGSTQPYGLDTQFTLLPEELKR